MAQLEPALRGVFAERVAAILGAHPGPGPGDVDRAVLQALVGLWMLPEFTQSRGSHWDRDPSGDLKGAQAGGRVDLMWT